MNGSLEQMHAFCEKKNLCVLFNFLTLMLMINGDFSHPTQSLFEHTRDLESLDLHLEGVY